MTLPGLENDAPGIEVEIPDETDEVSEPEESTAIVLFGSDETAMICEIDVKTGEVLRDECAPLETASALEAAAYIGPRLAAATADLKGLEAEKAAWLEKINQQYNGRINQAKRRVEWLSGGAGFYETLRAFAAQAILKRRTKSVGVGLLTLAFRSKAARVVIEDEKKALDYCKRLLPEAVRTKEEVLVSLIPKTTKAPWLAGTLKLPTDTGLKIEGKDEVFEIK